jgi:hypothetical protein
VSAHVALGLGTVAGLIVGPWLFSWRERIAAVRAHNINGRNL